MYQGPVKLSLDNAGPFALGWQIDWIFNIFGGYVPYVYQAKDLIHQAKRWQIQSMGKSTPRRSVPA